MQKIYEEEKKTEGKEEKLTNLGHAIQNPEHIRSEIHLKFVLITVELMRAIEKEVKYQCVFYISYSIETKTT
uniref:Uncharacterized protein n=1 Tax=Glossina brevipalpis TaxID=37001 RepID=A0A1A9W8S7_9MUSC